MDYRMSKVLTFSDGSIYVKRYGSFGRVKLSNDPFLENRDMEVCYIPIADYPISTNNKGSTIKVELSLFDYLDNFHTKQASIWMRTPRMLWCNRPYVGDPLGSTLASGADPTPVLECITGSGNVLRVIGETATHYEVWALPLSEDIKKFTPLQFNPYNYPWIFWKTNARTRDNVLQKVGAGLDVWHLNIRKPTNRHYIHKSMLTMFTACPFTINYGGTNYTIVDYQCLGADVYGITSLDTRIPLLVKGVHLTDWQSGQPVV